MKLPKDVEEKALELADCSPVVPPKPSKYRNQKVTIDGHKFDSRREAAHYLKLLALQAAGAISDLQLQVRFPCVVEGVKVCVWISDFTYVQDGEWHVVDCKGMKTPVYKLKKRLVEALYDFKIEEV